MTRTRGFALLEVLTTCAAMLPVVFAVMGTSTYTMKAIRANERAAASVVAIENADGRMEELVRSALLSSMTTDPAAVAVWNSQQLRAGTAEQCLTFQCVVNVEDATTGVSDPNGTYTMTGSGLSATRSLFFQLDATEEANGVDDDGDGMVDEGELVYADGDHLTTVQRGVEAFQITLVDRRLQLRMTCSVRDGDGNRRRVTLTQTYCVRNP